MSKGSKYYGIVGYTRWQECVDLGLLDVDLFFSLIEQNNINTVRFNHDHTEFIIKSNYDASKNYLKQRANELKIPYREYTYERILDEILKQEWIGEP